MNLLELWILFIFILHLSMIKIDYWNTQLTYHYSVSIKIYSNGYSRYDSYCMINQWLIILICRKRWRIRLVPDTASLFLRFVLIFQPVDTNFVQKNLQCFALVASIWPGKSCDLTSLYWLGNQDFFQGIFGKNGGGRKEISNTFV